MSSCEDIRTIKGIGDKTAKLFNRLGVYTTNDLMRFYPRTYSKFNEPLKISSELVNTNFSVRLCILDDFKFKKVRNLNIGTGRASDGETTVNIAFFNTPYYKSRLTKGSTYIFNGKLLYEKGTYVMEQPSFYTEAEYKNLLSSLIPVYSLTKGLSNKTVEKAVRECIGNDNCSELYEEYLPKELISEYSLTDKKSAYLGMHFPKDITEYKEARKRLVFDELFLFLYTLRYFKGSGKKERSEYPMIMTAYPKRLMESLPYELTGAQKKAFEEISEDMTSGYVMNRLIQGDVGSGKTIIAFLSLLLCVDNGHQGAFMAPTEILAGQHFENLTELTEKYGLPFKCALLTGSTSAKDKKKIYEDLLSGDINVVIGTHAIITEKVGFKDLALVITDEQHRFGVRQRQSLAGKSNDKLPHILVMSATPIPRSLAIVIYGDLDISVIDEKPSRRLPIKNCVVGTSYRNTAYKFMYDEIKRGHQIYIICPMVESSESLPDVCDVTDYTESLKKVFPNDVRIESLNGRQKSSVKTQIMNDFADRNIDILVSTTVIEVGIDVPNATVMMIENAERFGLSALHQLRGRIGRGDAQSYCIFINGSRDFEPNKRLNILERSNDGFAIAKEDLKIRGAGDIFGIRQSGFMEFELADVYEDSKLILQIGKSLENADLSDKKLKRYLDEHINKFVDFKTI